MSSFKKIDFINTTEIDKFILYRKDTYHSEYLLTTIKCIFYQVKLKLTLQKYQF